MDTTILSANEKKACEKKYLSYIVMLCSEPSYLDIIVSCTFNFRKVINEIITKLQNENVEDVYMFYLFGKTLLHFLQEKCIKNIECFQSFTKDYIETTDHERVSVDDKKKLLGCLPN